MKWQEGLAIAGALSGGNLGKAAQIPLQQQNKRKDRKAFVSGASKGAKYYDFFNRDNDGPV